MILEAVAFGAAALGLAFGAASWRLARSWARDCSECRIIIARKGKVVLDAPLTEWLAWNKALPKRERSRGGVIFHDRGVQVALGRPKIGVPSAKVEQQRTIKEPSSSKAKAAAA